MAAAPCGRPPRPNPPPRGRRVGRGLVRLGLVVVVVLGAACLDPPDPGRDEARRVIGELDRIGNTRPEARGRLLDALAERHLDDESARRVRDLCVGAYRALARVRTLPAGTAATAASASPTPSSPSPGGSPEQQRARARLIAEYLELKASNDDADKRHRRCREALGGLRRDTR
ncbi:MAG: hypothetical protein AAGA56_14295 [Myxococcota bacterium]